MKATSIVAVATLIIGCASAAPAFATNAGGISAMSIPLTSIEDFVATSSDNDIWAIVDITKDFKFVFQVSGFRRAHITPIEFIFGLEDQGYIIIDADAIDRLIEVKRTP